MNPDSIPANRTALDRKRKAHGMTLAHVQNLARQARANGETEKAETYDRMAENVKHIIRRLAARSSGL